MRAGLRQASLRDKAMRSMPPFRPENDSVRLVIIVWLLVVCTIYSSINSIIPGISFVTLALKFEDSVGVLTAS